MKRNLGFVVGLLFLLAYLNFALGWVALSQRLTLVLAFGIGPAAILAVIGLSESLGTVFSPRTIRTGSVFLIVAFALLTLMLTTQQAIFIEYRQLRGGGPASEAPETLRQAFALVNKVQLGADVAFDVFYSLGLIITSLALLRQAVLPRLVGAYGLLFGGGLLLLNIWTFPEPPALAGAVDLGPATIVWWVGLLFLGHRVKKPNPPTSRGSEG